MKAASLNITFHGLHHVVLVLSIVTVPKSSGSHTCPWPRTLILVGSIPYLLALSEGSEGVSQ
jgi:hypothetical protein